VPDETERPLTTLLSRLPEPRTRDFASVSYTRAVSRTDELNILSSGRCRTMAIMATVAGPLSRCALGKVADALSSARGEISPDRARRPQTRYVF
jgi:hypothetical protein